MILAPVVMVSACAILQSGLLARYAAINDRLRAMAAERLALLRLAPGVDPFAAERFQEIAGQVPGLLHRHMLARNAVLAVYSAVFSFVLDMVLIAASVLVGSNLAAGAVLIVFLLSTIILLLGVSFAVVEVRSSQADVHYEVRRVMSLPVPGRDEPKGG